MGPSRSRNTRPRWLTGQSGARAGSGTNSDTHRSGNPRRLIGPADLAGCTRRGRGGFLGRLRATKPDWRTGQPHMRRPQAVMRKKAFSGACCWGQKAGEGGAAA